MTVDFLLKNDLEQFKHELIAELKQIFNPARLKENKKEWLTDGETQKLLSISRTKLYQLRQEGELPYSTIGGRVYYKQEDITNLLNKNLRNYE